MVPTSCSNLLEQSFLLLFYSTRRDPPVEFHCLDPSTQQTWKISYSYHVGASGLCSFHMSRQPTYCNLITGSCKSEQLTMKHICLEQPYYLCSASENSSPDHSGTSAVRSVYSSVQVCACGCFVYLTCPALLWRLHFSMQSASSAVCFLAAST